MDDQNQNKISFLKKWAPVFILSLALAIIIIDTTLLNVALSTVIKDLHTDIQSIQWVITVYSLALAALTITGGRLGDLFGRKKMFILGAATFAVGSFIASISHSVGTMIAGESIIEGIGAAMMMPATASLLVSTYRGRDRAIAMGVWGGIAAASSAIGPILGGYLTTNFSWRWGFRINVFVAALLIIGSFVVKECHDKEEKPSLDWIGVFLSSTGLLALVFGIIESTTYGWWKAKAAFIFMKHVLDLGGYSVVPYSLAIGIILLILFLLWESKMAKSDSTPLVSLKLFKNSQFTSSLIVTSVMSIGQAGIIFSLPIFFQAVRNLDAYHTGLAFLPMSLTALVFAPLSAVLGRKFPPKRIIQFGFVSFIVALILIHRTLNTGTTIADLAPGLIFYGIGIGSSMSLLSNMTLSAVSVEEAGEASGVSNTFRQLGATLGSAIIGAALLSAIGTNLSKGIAQSSVIPSSAKTIITNEVSNQTSNVEFGGGAQISGNVPTGISNEITSISHRSIADSNRLALLYTLLFACFGFLATFFLPNRRNLEQNQSVAKKN